jgi:hypothetical protein
MRSIDPVKIHLDAAEAEKLLALDAKADRLVAQMQIGKVVKRDFRSLDRRVALARDARDCPVVSYVDVGAMLAQSCAHNAVRRDDHVVDAAAVMADRHLLLEVETSGQSARKNDDRHRRKRPFRPEPAHNHKSLPGAPPRPRLT